MAVVGYILVMASMFGAALLFGESIASAGVLLLFYGLYFGVMGRDFAEAATERMANNIGNYLFFRFFCSFRNQICFSFLILHLFYIVYVLIYSQGITTRRAFPPSRPPPTPAFCATMF
jgi:hypothetical protein